MGRKIVTPLILNLRKWCAWVVNITLSLL